MKAIIEALMSSDKKALSFFEDSLSICAHEHTLSRHILLRFKSTGGEMIAIFPPWLNLEQLGTYEAGLKGPDGTHFEDGFSPTALLVSFVQDYLRANTQGMIVCENFGWERRHLDVLQWPPPRVACYGDNEVYHLITPDIKDDIEQIEAGVIERHRWQTGICVPVASVPSGDIPNEDVLEQLSRSASHVFIPAFDGTGYLVWRIA